MGSTGALSSSPVLVACATGRETRALQPLVKQWGIRLLTTGLGERKTASFLEQELTRHTPPILVFTGVAGALSQELTMGRMILPGAWCLESGECFQNSPQLLELLRSKSWSVEGVGLTVKRPVLRSSRRAFLHRETGALICDMEAAAALRIASARNLPALALKVVSDTAAGTRADFWRHLDSNLDHLRTAVASLLRDLEVPPAGPAIEGKDEG